MNKIITYFLIYFLFFGITNIANADTGITMLEIECDKELDNIKISPFILWNDSTVHNGVTLSDPIGSPEQKIGKSTYYYFKELYGKKFNYVCNTKDRLLNIEIFNKVLNFEEIYLSKKKTAFINFETEIGNAWDVYGPTFFLRSMKPDVWEMCFGSEDNNKINCKPMHYKADESEMRIK